MPLPRCLSAIGSGVLRRIRLSPGRPDRIGWAGALGARGIAEGAFLGRAEVTDRVIAVVKNHEKVDQSKVNPTSSFQKDLGLDSLDQVEVVMAFEEEFCIEIPDSEADKIGGTEDAINYVCNHPMAK
ncbi:unnamed protein product [Ostreobium quekettii]|uniref:Acyl carrier protein n=1 Tax=Ostreobium quekettii TaxID=121088 RepID=A0A8S1IM07_9CHLO|nr:unnamed protein product [Ostreobium quekettii]|eukprot:evm.model.scf_3269.1 EVM.evm.TU.scf_3269.1   scf_3269:1568-2760(-)